MQTQECKYDNLLDSKYSWDSTKVSQIRMHAKQDFRLIGDIIIIIIIIVIEKIIPKRANSKCVRVVSIWFATKVRAGCDFHGKSFDSNLSSKNGKRFGIMVQKYSFKLNFCQCSFIHVIYNSVWSSHQNDSSFGWL